MARRSGFPPDRRKTVLRARGLAGVAQDPAALNIPFIPSEIKQVMPLPTAKAMDRIIKALADQP